MKETAYTNISEQGMVWFREEKIEINFRLNEDQWKRQCLLTRRKIHYEPLGDEYRKEEDMLYIFE